MDGLQRNKSFDTFTEAVQALICDSITPTNKSTNSSSKNHLLKKVEIDRLWRVESFETFTKIVQTLICDSVAPMNKSTNSS